MWLSACGYYLRSGMPSEETLDHLRQPTFDNWQWEDAEMMFLVQQMFMDLGLVDTFHIEVRYCYQRNCLPVSVLKTWQH